MRPVLRAVRSAAWILASRDTGGASAEEEDDDGVFLLPPQPPMALPVLLLVLRDDDVRCCGCGRRGAGTASLVMPWAVLKAGLSLPRKREGGGMVHGRCFESEPK